MFHLKKLDFTFVRLFALYMNYIIGIEQIPYICVADPYFMHEGFLAVCAVHREYARDYIVDFMVANKDKETILVPYHALLVIRADILPSISIIHLHGGG